NATFEKKIETWKEVYGYSRRWSVLKLETFLAILGLKLHDAYIDDENTGYILTKQKVFIKCSCGEIFSTRIRDLIKGHLTQHMLECKYREKHFETLSGIPRI